MSSLSNKAESAILGTLLANPDHPAAATLTPADFQHPGYQAVFTAITHVRHRHPDLDSDARVADVAHVAGAPGLDIAALQRMREGAPPDSHVPAYVQMVQSGAFRARIADHAENLSRAIDVGTASPDLQGLADALHRQATTHTPTSNTVTEGASTDRSSATPVGQRHQLEDTVLAGLLQFPEQARALSGILPPDSFTSHQRRDVFETTISMAEAGDPVDATIVGWEIHRTAYIRQLATGTPDRPDPEPLTVYLDRLTHQPVTAHTAMTAAKHLLTDDLATTLHNRAATTGARPTITPATLHTRIQPRATPTPVARTINPPPRPAPPPQPGPRINGTGGALR